jgi:type III restriction enzyme
MRYDPEQPNRAKLELILLLQNQTVWDALESMALARIGELFERHKPAIRKLTGSQQEDYNKIREISKQPEPLEYIPPLSVFLPVDLDPESGFKEYPKHLLLGDGDRYFAKLNEWEVLTITAELSSAKVKGWLRNYERKKWALSLPYDYKGQQRATWPDFLVLRETGKGNLEVDILEPHSPHLDDSYAKAKGLAQYAREHYAKFGRIEIIRIVKGAIKRLDLNHDETRRRVLQVDSNAGLDLLFGITKADFPA